MCVMCASNACEREMCVMCVRARRKEQGGREKQEGKHEEERIDYTTTLLPVGQSRKDM